MPWPSILERTDANGRRSSLLSLGSMVNSAAKNFQSYFGSIDLTPKSKQQISEIANAGGKVPKGSTFSSSEGGWVPEPKKDNKDAKDANKKRKARAGKASDGRSEKKQARQQGRAVVGVAAGRSGAASRADAPGAGTGHGMTGGPGTGHRMARLSRPPARYDSL